MDLGGTAMPTSSAGSWTVFALEQEASVDCFSPAPKCGKTLQVSGWVEQLHSSHAAIYHGSTESEKWLSIAVVNMMKVCTGSYIAQRTADATDLAQMIEARSTIASNLFLHIQMCVQNNSQIVHRRQEVHGLWTQVILVNFVQHLLPAYPHELHFVLIDFQSVHLHPVV